MDVPALHTDLTDSILRCAVLVHRGIGPGLPEHSYQKSLALEFAANAIRFVDDHAIVVRYRDVIVGSHRPDFIVENKVIVELKSVTNVDPVHAKQVLTYLRVTGLRVALLLNFNVVSMNHGIKRYQL
jgi:GxxExxY protein